MKSLFLPPVRIQGVGGSSPLSPTIFASFACEQAVLSFELQIVHSALDPILTYCFARGDGETGGFGNGPGRFISSGSASSGFRGLDWYPLVRLLVPVESALVLHQLLPLVLLAFSRPDPV
jgi:hypothetical protein